MTHGIVVVCGLAAVFSMPAISRSAAAPPRVDAAADQEIRARLSIRDYAVVEPSVTNTDGDSLRVDMLLDGRPITAWVDPFSLRAADFRVLIDDGASLHEAPLPPVTTYRGSIAGAAEGDEATFSIVRDGESIRVEGGILHHGEPWTIQHILTSAGPLHIVYRNADAAHDDLTCGADEHLHASPAHDHGDVPESEDGLRGSGTGCNRVCRIAFDADFEFYTANGSSTPATTADIESVMAGVQVVYTRDVGITYEIGTIIIRTIAADPYTTFDANTMLVTEMRNEWLNNQTGVSRDVAHMFTGKDFTGSTIGIAYLSGVCNSFGYGITQRYGNLATRTAICNHELGHNWSAPHCNSSPDCSIMCSGLGGCTGNSTSFSSTSVSSITSYRNSAACLDQGPNIPPYVANDSGSTLDRAPVTIDVLANDFSSDCQATLIGMFSAVSAQGGSVVRSVGTGPGGRDRLMYTPPAAPLPLPETDSFTYFATDGVDSTLATVNVTNALARPADSPGPTSPGLAVSYYALNAPVSLPNFASLAPYLTGSVTLINAAATAGNFMTSERADNVGAVFAGYIVIPSTGVYTLSTESDDGSALFIGATQVVNNDGTHGMTTASGTITLAAGPHALRIEYFDGSGSAGLILRIAGPTFPSQVVPASMLVYSTPVTPPSSDNCASAAAISDGVTPISTAGATTDGPFHACFFGTSPAHDDVWFQYNSSVSGTLTASVCNANFDTRLAVYADAGCTSLESRLLACNDDACGTGSQLTLNITAGQSYMIRVGGAAVGASGTASLVLASDPTEILLGSFQTSTVVPGVGTVANEDIVAYNTTTGVWSMVFDGSDLGLATLTIDALAVLPSDDILLSFTTDANVTNLVGGPAGLLTDDADIVRFTPATLGTTTSGTLDFYFDGSDVGLDEGLNAEDIDALAVDGFGRLLISTGGSNNVLGTTATDEDIVQFTPTTTGASTTGAWAWLIDGSDVELSTTADEDIDGLAVDGSALLFSTIGNFGVPGFSGVNEDVIRFSPTSTGSTTVGVYAPFLTLAGLGIDTAANLYGLEYTINPLGSSSFLSLPAGAPLLAADVNDDGVLDSADYFDFLNTFFGGDAAGRIDPDFNGSGDIDAQDYFEFLEAMLMGR